MSEWFFLLGNTPELSLAELHRVYPHLEFKLAGPQLAQAAVSADLDPQTTLDRLGGVVKILAFDALLPDHSPEAVQQAVIDFLAKQPQAKITFGLAEMGRDHLPTVSLPHIKRELIAQGKGVRFVESPRAGLSASVLIHHPGVFEVAVMQTPTGTYLAHTLATQNIDGWTTRDRYKPYADRKKGMLPPKVARMMVNLALGSQPVKDAVLYDPFCGSGTVLLEAALLGCTVIGSDLDPNSVFGTQSNIEWLSKTYNQEFAGSAFLSDAASARAQQFPKPVTYLVTEPFLGKQTPSPALLPNIYKGLEKQYLGAFKNWTRLLADNAELVVIFPQVEVGKKTFTLESLIDKIAALGYTMSSEPLLYHRPRAVVQRQIYRFTFKKR